LVFRQRRQEQGEQQQQQQQELEWLVLAPLATDKLRVVYDVRRGGDDGGGGGGRSLDGESENGLRQDHDHDYLGVLITAIKEVLEDLGYFAKGGWSNDSFEFSLKGWPWRSRSESGVKLRIMLMRLFEALEGHRWKLYTACVMRSGTDSERCLDTWFFVRELGKGLGRGSCHIHLR
jgi:hypothetical protein